MLSPIHSTKHIVQWQGLGVASSAIINLEIAKSVVLQDANLSTEVQEGAVVKAVFVEVWLTSDDATQGSCTATIEKRSGGQVAMTLTQSNAMYGYVNKKNILHTSQGLVPPNIQAGIPLIRQWIKIPKGKQRFGLDDILVLNVSGITNGANICGVAIYKEYT